MLRIICLGILVTLLMGNTGCYRGKGVGALPATMQFMVDDAVQTEVKFDIGVVPARDFTADYIDSLSLADMTVGTHAVQTDKPLQIEKLFSGSYYYVIFLRGSPKRSFPKKIYLSGGNNLVPEIHMGLFNNE